MDETFAVNHKPSQSSDPLCRGLLLLCARLRRETSAAALTEGLQLINGRLPTHLIPRALRRVGINAELTHLPLGQIDDYLLPALLILKDGNTLLLAEINKTDAAVLIPEVQGGVERLTIEQLEAMYSGKIILAKCEYRADARLGNYAKARDEHWFFGPLKKCRRTYLEVAIAALTANLLATVSALFAMQVYDRVVPNNAFDTLWLLTCGVTLAIFFDGILRIMRGYILNVLGKRLDLQLSTLLFSRVLGARLEAKPASMGAFSTQVREFESVREFFTSSSAALISDLPFMFIFLVLIALIGGPVVWVPVIASILMVLPGVLAQYRLEFLSRQHLREGAMKNSVLLESFEHLETVKSSGAEGRCLYYWEAITAKLAGTAMKTYITTTTLSYCAAMVQQLCYVGVVAFGVYRISDGAMTVGALIACSILSSRAIAPLSQAAAILGRWQHTRVAMEGLNQLMNAPQERAENRQFVHLERVAGHYLLNDIKWCHGEGPAVLNISSLSIRQGERVAILGGNGAGKSTLLRLLAGLVDVQSGNVQLDNINLSQIDPADRQRNIGYLPQDVALFFGTLRENLNLANAAISDAQLLETLDGIGLGAFVRAHPLGLDMPIGGNGSLSGGQRQAVGLARVLLKDPAVLLLDEPTAAFDQTSETHLIHYLQQWLGKRTLIVTTHKRNVLALVDRAIVMRHGKIVQDAPVGQVLAQGNQVAPAQRVKEEAL